MAHYHYDIMLPKPYKLILDGYHVLIGGTTGSGKSTLVKGLINAINEEMPFAYKLVLIDAKMVELSRFKPNAFMYAENMKAIKKTLLDCEALMMARYKKMKRQGLTEYNGEHLLIIIDEFADLMDNKKEFLPIISRLARLGRASRVQLILATQNPARTSGLPASLNSNINCRIALRCNDKTESKQIIKGYGAELLPKYGKCIIQCPNEPTCIYSVPMDYKDHEAIYYKPQKLPIKHLERAKRQKARILTSGKIARCKSLCKSIYKLKKRE